MKQFHKGRGAGDNPKNRFEGIYIEADEEYEGIEPSPETEFITDDSDTILSVNNSPDVPFTYSINPYRGCEHGCIYCYARPTHEYLGYSAGKDFESKIMVKRKAPELLKKMLTKDSWEPQTISISGVTDPYQPAERKEELTRQILRVLTDFRNPYTIVTKNKLVTRDLDILSEMAGFNGVKVMISLTTLDVRLASIMEPRTSRPNARLRAIEQLTEAGIPVGVLVAPVIPGLTDHEMPQLLQSARNAGARFAGYVVLRLPHSNKELFEQWVTEHFPNRKDKILNRVRALRGGDLNSTDFGDRMRGEGEFAEQINKMFHIYRQTYGYDDDGPPLSTTHFNREAAAGQMRLF